MFKYSSSPPYNFPAAEQFVLYAFASISDTSDPTDTWIAELEAAGKAPSNEYNDCEQLLLWIDRLCSDAKRHLKLKSSHNFAVNKPNEFKL